MTTRLGASGLQVPLGFVGRGTPHATAAEAHDRLMLTKAMDLSAARKAAIPLPVTPKDLQG